MTYPPVTQFETRTLEAEAMARLSRDRRAAVRVDEGQATPGTRRRSAKRDGDLFQQVQRVLQAVLHA
jgi:hypothetical protein